MPEATALCSPQLSWLAATSAWIAAVLLWGVGAEAVYLGHRLSGAFLLADAVIVSILEATTVCCLIAHSGNCNNNCRTGSSCCIPGMLRYAEQLVAMIDSYRRGVVYALLTVPCFVQLHKYWLPAVPGAALILSAAFYASKICCNRKAVLYDFGKMPTFVRFEEDPCSVTQEILQLPQPATGHQYQQRNIYQPCWQVSDAPDCNSCASEPVPPRLPPRTRGAGGIQDGNTVDIAPPAPPPRRRQLVKSPVRQELQHQRDQKAADRLCLIGDDDEAGGEGGRGVSFCD